MKKMVINHLEKLFVTSDAATIMKEMEVAHPAANMIVLASKQMAIEASIIIQKKIPIYILTC